MPDLIRALTRSLGDLIPAGRLRWQALAVVLIGTVIPLSELLATRLFADVITTTRTEDLDTSALVIPVVAFVVLFMSTRAAHYGQRLYRIRFFQRAFRATPRQSPPQLESWEWALAMELLTLLTSAAQLVVIAGFFAMVAPVFGIINGLLLLALVDLIARIFQRQRTEQRAFVERKRAGERVSPSLKLRSRVASAELGGLLSSGAVVSLLMILIAMNIAGVITAASTMVLFLGLRMQNSTVAAASGALMRLARAQANTS